MEEHADAYASPQKSRTAAQGLERQFATHVNMTPPASFEARKFQHSPFASWSNKVVPAPATESRHQVGSIPRSHAFASLAPLTKMSDRNHDSEFETRDLFDQRDGNGIKRTIPLHQVSPYASSNVSNHQQMHAFSDLWHRRDPSDGSRSSASHTSVTNGIEHSSLAGPSSQPMLRTGSNESADSNLSNGSRRLTRPPGFLPSAALNEDDDIAMQVDSDDDVDTQPPPSPSPFLDPSLPAHPASSSFVDLAQPMLQPGVRAVRNAHSRRASSSTASGSAGSASITSSFQAASSRSRAPSSNSLSSAAGMTLSAHTPARTRSSTSGGIDQIDGHTIHTDTGARRHQHQHHRHHQQHTQHQRSHRVRASSSAALHRPLTEFLTPRSTSASAMLGDKLPGVANLFEFATQPRPIIRPSDPDPGSTPLRDTKRRSSGTTLGSFASGKLFEDEIQAVESSKLDVTSPEDKDVVPGLSTPARRAPRSRLSSHKDFPGGLESGFGTPHQLFGGTPSTADDSGVAFGDEDQYANSRRKKSGSFMSHQARESPLLATARSTHLFNDQSSPVRPSSNDAGGTPPRRQIGFHGDSPAPRPAAMVPHPFGPKERSSLAQETRFCNSSEDGSAQSSPDAIPRSRSRTATASPARKMRERRPTSEAVDNNHYLTPQNFRSVKPLQAAFMSTGLVSKRNRARENSEGSGAEAFPFPSKPNFGHALGLREVVAAASAQAASAGDRPNHAMPDTPVKKSTSSTMIPFPKPSSALRLQNGPGFLLGPSPLGAHSPAKDSPSSSTSAESPNLADGCDSPTYNLMSLSPPQASTPAVSNAFNLAYSNLARSRRAPNAQSGPFRSFTPGDTTEDEGNLSDVSHSPSLLSGRTRDAQKLQKGKRPGMKTTNSSETAATRKTLSINTAKAMAAPKTLRVRSAGLGRKTISRNNTSTTANEANGFEADSVSSTFAPATPLNVVSSLAPADDEIIPMTPTRNAAQIKWFEAAQVLTTPSPSSRRHAAQKLRAHRLELMQTRRKSRLSETSTCQDTPMKNSPVSTAFAAHEEPDSFGQPHQVIDQGDSRLEAHFVVDHVIGSGEFSEVLKVISKSTGYAYAVKRMKKAYSGPKDRLRRLEEVDVLRQLSTSGKPHPNIVSLFDAWEEEGHLFLQLELCPLGSLAFFLEQYGQQVGALEEPRLWKVLAELSSGLAYIHDQNILHLDLKPANVLITEYGSLKIGDFGMATRWPLADDDTILQGAGVEAGAAVEQRAPHRGLEREGDREYLAPEVIFRGRYGKAADIFSLGLIVLEAAGNVELPDNGEPWQKLRRNDFSDVDLSALSGSMLRMLESMLCSEPEMRPTAQEIVDTPMLETVRGIMSRGLSATEMDQLPEFSESSTSGSLACLTESSSMQSVQSQSESSNPNAGLSDSEADSSMQLSESGSALGLSGIPCSVSGQTSISTSASSYGSNTVLKFRGALIQEPEEEFLREVIGSDPMEQDEVARERRTGYSTSISSLGSSIGSPSEFGHKDRRARRPLSVVQPLDLNRTASHSKRDRFHLDLDQDGDAMDLDG